MSKQITKKEFESYNHANRPPAFQLVIDEKEWFATDTGGALGVLIRDKTDNDWGYAILAPDTQSSHRWIDGDTTIPTQDSARAQLLAALDKIEASGQKVFPQE